MLVPIDLVEAGSIVRQERPNPDFDDGYAIHLFFILKQSDGNGGR